MTPLVRDGVTLWNGDALEVLRQLPDDSIDACITDPPYNVGKPGYGEAFDDRNPDYEAWLGLIFAEVGRVVRDGLIYTPGTRNALRAREVLDATPFRPHRLLGWHKREFAGDKWNGGPAMCWEPVIWASKAEKPYYRRGFGHWGRDFFVVDSYRRERVGFDHPCPKPLDVMRWLVGLFVPEGGSVLDPFAGTGTTLLAARERGLAAVGIEISAEWCAETEHRLAQLPLVTEFVA